MSIKRNVAFLHLIQIADYALPIIVIPYLTRCLGPAKFGQIGFAQGFVQFLVLFTDFGFNYTATRAVAINKLNSDAVRQIYWTTTLSKAALAFIAICLGGAVAWGTPVLRDDRVILTIALAMVVATVLTPIWLFHGLDRLPAVSLASFVVRLGALPLYFVFVHSPDDTVAAACLQFLPALVPGLLLSFYIHTTGLIRRGPIDLSFRALSAGWRSAKEVFLGSALTTVYTSANVILLRLISGNEAVGYFSAADKIINPVKLLFLPLIQAHYPGSCRLYEEGRYASARTVARRIILLITLSGAPVAICCWLFARPVIPWILGASFTPSIPTLYILILLPPIVSAATAHLMLEVLASGKQSSVKRIYAAGAVVHAVYAPLLIWHFGTIGAAISVVLTETVVLTLFSRQANRLYQPG